jgi:tyrosine-protein phosphatase YwqE
MVFKNEEKAKQLIVEIVSSEYVDIIPGKGLYFNDDIVYDKNFSHITNDDEYLLIEEKLKSIVKLINDDPNLVHKDLEDELWYMV